MRPFNSSNAAILLANLPNREENIDWPVGFYVATRQTKHMKRPPIEAFGLFLIKEYDTFRISNVGE